MYGAPDLSIATAVVVYKHMKSDVSLSKAFALMAMHYQSRERGPISFLGLNTRKSATQIGS
jgi:hypothetical protein